MIIKSVTLKDFISHEDTKIDFPAGVTVLIGPNGAGKTSIIDAIVFGLFGEKVRGDRVEDLIRRGCTVMKVEVVFEQGNQRYKVITTRKKKEVEVVLEREGFGIIATSTGEVRREISKIIEIDKETLLRSIIVRQGEIASLVEEDPKERKNLFGRLLGLENLEKAWENMNELIEHFRNFSKDYDHIDKQLSEKEEDLNRILDDQKNIEKEIEELKGEIEQKELEYQKISKKVEDLKNKKEKYEEFQNELLRIETEINYNEERLQEIKEKLEKAREAKKETEKLKPDVDKIPHLENWIRFSEIIRTKQQVLKEKENSLKRIRTNKSVLKETKQSYNEYISLNMELNELENKINDLRNVHEQSVEKTSSLQNLKQLLNYHNEELEKLRDKILRYLPDTTDKAKKNKLEQLKLKKKEIEDSISELKKKEGELEGRKNEINKYLSILGESDKCPVCKSDLTPEHRESVKKEFHKEIDNIISKLKDIENDLKKYNSEKKGTEDELTEVNKLDLELMQNISHKIERYKLEINDIDRELNELEPRVKELECVQKKFKELKNRQESLKEGYEKYITAERILKMEKDEEDKILAEVEEFKNEINDYESKLNELSGKIGYIPKDPKEELDELNNVKERFDSLMKLSSQVEELVNEKKEKEREIKNCERKRKKILDKIKEINFNKEEFDKVNCNLNEVNRKLSELEGRINEKHNQKKRIEDDIKSIRESIKKLKKELIKAEKFKKFTSELENIRRSFSRDGIQKLLRQIAAPKITEFAGIYLEKFNLDITDIIVSENFDISVIKRGEMIPLSSLSGGEKVAVAIALRFAIAKAVSGKVLTIIMDEPTTHLDEDRRRELVDIMKGFFKEDESIPYVIIVTHHQELEDVADTIYRVNKVEGVSIVTTDV